ncbi:MAG: DUF5635 domain-containing protein [Mobiluncus porci]|uniref:DUF5635 domain-containing protein n=1 Tax=Mobiluncus porci TaxID=2652278 RepID=UPI0023F31E55|nr:DUF5635 domain-containing protein [Mobiluncus porci]MDD7542513.1 DUF5635 domain-containing protein [Mobiluncus porci]MDY5748810.1 DUF5635 domain-containing protein [Mobiluncus porci]
MVANPQEYSRTHLEEEVREILSSVKLGRITKTRETESIDFKEEAGRRNGSDIEPGQPENPEAATKLADEVACMANTPHGGALILGVEDKTGKLIGTELDTQWLRHRIYQAIDVAPDITEQRVLGQRLLVLFVPPASEPVEDTKGRIRWRIGSSCEPVDRAQWWEYQRKLLHIDPMAQTSHYDLANARGQAIDLVKQENQGFSDLTNSELLTRIGAADSEGRLTKAGELLFTASSKSHINFTVLDVPGGDVLTFIESNPNFSLLEQLGEIEQALKIQNKNNKLTEGYAHLAVPQIPSSAVREAILNGLIHRDWNRQEPLDVRWLEGDSTLIVRSPGGFPRTITSANVLSNRAARYPALADLFRAIGLVDKQGIGVDRMYQAMITLGHRPPEIIEVSGPYVQTTLVGGKPVLPVMELVKKIVPEPRQRDVRIAIIFYGLFHSPFITIESLARDLQATEESAWNALAAATQTTIEGEPIVKRYREAWILGDSARKILKTHQGDIFAPGRYLTTDQDSLFETASAWIETFNSITTGDLMTLSGVSRGTALKCLQDMESVGVVRHAGSGRSVRYQRVTV